MKLVREHINEKFTAESDPMADMGIGYVSFKEVKKLAKNIKQKLEEIFPDQEVKFSFKEYGQRQKNIYSIDTRLIPSSFSFAEITFCGTKNAAEVWIDFSRKVQHAKGKLDPIIGWYVYDYLTSKIYQAKLEDYNKLVYNLINVLDYDKDRLISHSPPPLLRVPLHKFYTQVE